MDKIVFAKVKENAQIPARDSWNAGFDIYPCFEEESFIIEPHTTALVPTGIASAVPENYYIQIQERGSTGSKGIKYSAGVIDSSYRGEWFLATTNTNNKPILITKMDIASLPENVKELIEKAYIVYPYTKALFQGIVHCVHNELSVEEITFEELQPGLYYYTVEADGYEPYVPGYAFEVTEEGVLDGRENFYVVGNETNEKPMSEEFRVQVWAEDEHPMPQTKVWAYIEYPNELEEESKWGYEMVTDENGFLFFKSDLTDKTVPVVREFQLQEGCRMMLDYEDAPRDTTVAVEVKNGIGIARLTER